MRSSGSSTSCVATEQSQLAVSPSLGCSLTRGGSPLLRPQSGRTVQQAVSEAIDAL